MQSKGHTMSEQYAYNNDIIIYIVYFLPAGKCDFQAVMKGFSYREKGGIGETRLE